jgi:hypothetical protein
MHEIVAYMYVNVGKFSLNLSNSSAIDTFMSRLVLHKVYCTAMSVGLHKQYTNQKIKCKFDGNHGKWYSPIFN